MKTSTKNKKTSDKDIIKIILELNGNSVGFKIEKDVIKNQKILLNIFKLAFEELFNQE